MQTVQRKNVRNGIYTVTKGETFNVNGRQKTYYFDYYNYFVNGKGYSGYVGFGDGLHYFQNGEPVLCKTAEEGLLLFDTKGKLLKPDDENVLSINSQDMKDMAFTDIRYAEAAKDILDCDDVIIKEKDGVFRLESSKENVQSAYA